MCFISKFEAPLGFAAMLSPECLKCHQAGNEEAVAQQSN